MKDFIMLVTAAEDDSAVKAFSEEPLFCRLGYAQPYQDFKELKKIQLASRRRDVFEEDITLAVNVTDWLGRIGEEHFISAVKFFHDHRFRWKYIFIVNSPETSEVRAMYKLLKCYLKGDMVTDDKWQDKLKLEDYLTTLGFETSAADIFARVLVTDRFDSCRSEAFVRMVAEEIKEKTEHSTITTKDFKRYAEDADTIVAMLADIEILKLIEEREEKHV